MLKLQRDKYQEPTTWERFLIAVGLKSPAEFGFIDPNAFQSTFRDDDPEWKTKVCWLKMPNTQCLMFWKIPPATQYKDFQQLSVKTEEEKKEREDESLVEELPDKSVDKDRPDPRALDESSPNEEMSRKEIKPKQDDKTD